MLNKIRDLDENRLGWYILLALGLILLLVDITKWDYDFFYNVNYHSYIIGFMTWFIISLSDQTIVDLNLFKNNLLIAAAIFFVLLCKQLLTTISIPSLFAAGLPIIYLLTLRLLILIFYPTYPLAKPVLMQFSRTGNYWDGKEEGYKLVAKEKAISIISYFLPYLIIFLILFYATN